MIPGAAVRPIPWEVTDDADDFGNYHGHRVA